MTHRKLFSVTALLILSLTGCYHATVDTGLRPSGEVIEKNWAHGFLYGLVPPSEVDVAAGCTNGVAQVDTQLSFLNQLASILSAGIYTPMEITVLCAVGPDRTSAVETSRTITLPEGANRSAVQAAVERAAELSLREGQSAFVRFSAE